MPPKRMRHATEHTAASESDNESITSLLNKPDKMLQLYRALQAMGNQQEHSKKREVYQHSVLKICGTYRDYDYEKPWAGAKDCSGHGSGFIVRYKDKLFVMTNAHVVNSGDLTVRFADDSNNYPAQILQIDNDCDLAIISISDPKFWTKAKPLNLGNMPKLRDEIVRLGFPMGGEELCVESGKISRIEVNSYAHTDASLLQMQVSAHQNPGNSGGPVINEQGEVVGVSFQSQWDGAGLHYSIPAPIIQHFLDDYLNSLENGCAYQGFPALGNYWQTTDNSSFKEHFGLGNSGTGIYVRQVHPLCSSFDILKEGDIIVEIDGYQIKDDGTIATDFSSRLDFNYAITSKHIGDSIKLKVIRNGQQLELNVVLRYRAKTTTLIAAREYDKPPTYYIACGVVLIPATENAIEDAELDDPDDPLDGLMNRLKTKPGEELVLVSTVLENKYTKNAVSIAGEILKFINGVKVDSLRHAISIIESCQSPHIVLSTADHSVVVIKNISREEQMKLLEKRQIYRDRSDDLLVPVVYKPGCPEYDQQRKETSRSSLCLT